MLTRAISQGSIVLMLCAAGLTAATTMHANDTGAETAKMDAEHAAALIAAMRGTSPIACALATRPISSGWGGRGSYNGPESIGLAADSVLAWATSSEMSAATIPLLRAGLADQDACVRRTAAGLLGRAHISSLSSELRAELANGNPVTRQAALLAVGYAGRKTDRSAAESALRDADGDVRLAGVWALGMIGDPASIPVLASMLSSDPDARMRRAAAVALGQIDG